MKMSKGRLIVFSAPSGCGKGTMLEEILKEGSFRCSISATTRDPRPGEADGVNYYYMNNDEFAEHIKNNDFLEYALYCDHYYGTLLSEVEPYLEKGINVILEIEVQGAMRVKEIRPDGIFIFVAPPSIQELRRRLHKRGTEAEDVIEQRVSEAAGEIEQSVNYDYIIINDALEDAVSDFFDIINAEKLKAEFSAKKIEEVLGKCSDQQ